MEFFHSENRALDPETRVFYSDVLRALTEEKIPFLVGGAYALANYVGIVRHTKDLDLFVRPMHRDAVLRVLERKGYRTEITQRVWLAKAFSDDAFVDIIYRSGNGTGEVDDEWFIHSQESTVLDVAVRLCPVEETIWQKAFIMERERFDGADVAHYLLAQADRLDWDRLLRRFGAHWRVLFAHLILFGFIYPGKRDLIPEPVLDELSARMNEERHSDAPLPALCQGTFLSRFFSLVDVRLWGYEDGRFHHPRGTLRWEDIYKWQHELASRLKEQLTVTGISLEDSSMTPPQGAEPPQKKRSA